MKTNILLLSLSLNLFLPLIVTAYSKPAATLQAEHSATSNMCRAAELFIKSLNDQQLAQATFDFEDTIRSTWAYLPDKYIKPNGIRTGLKIKDMTPQQRILAYGLLNSALSQKGALTVNTIMALEQVLYDLERKNPIRDPHLYYLSVFGNPSKSKTWAWRFEGHHLSLNITLINGQNLAVTPNFYGGNPGIVKTGKFQGLQVLAEEENIARDLALSLTSTQLKKALISNKPPRDIYSKSKTKIERSFFDLKQGITYKDLDADQKEKLLKLIKVYTEKFRPGLLAQKVRTPLNETESMVFAWAGSLEKAEGHYYRIVTENHLIEYDNVQNKASHPHCVWREFDGDFGENLLMKHHLKHH
ncbi:MAG: DUF3500 domain-containing protein [Lentisphaeraceae bacterium]|nr:DUF3500 domain-containing protein [Lentisphaeraceae bacterium]